MTKRKSKAPPPEVREDLTREQLKNRSERRRWAAIKAWRTRRARAALDTRTPV